MNLTERQIKEIYKLCNISCIDICEAYKYSNDDDEPGDTLCSLCFKNNQQFFVPTDKFIEEINKVLEEK